jgi:hypothetical protein
MASNFASLLPGRNPTGTFPGNDVGVSERIGSTSGTNPMLPTNNLPTGAPASNAYDPTSVVPSFGANGGAYSTTNLAGGTGSSANPFGTPNTPLTPASIVGSWGTMSPSEQKSFLAELSKTYGSGVAGAITSFLSGGAGFNQDAINNLFAALQPGINQGEENLMDQFSTSGNRFGSGAQIGLADYLSQVNLNEGQIESQVYEQSVSDYMNTLLNVGNTNAKRISQSPSGLDSLTSLLSGLGGGSGISSLTNSLSSLFSGGSSTASSAGGGIGSLISGSGTGADATLDSIFDVTAGLAV